MLLPTLLSISQTLKFFFNVCPFLVHEGSVRALERRTPLLSCYPEEPSPAYIENIEQEREMYSEQRKVSILTNIKCIFVLV